MGRHRTRLLLVAGLIAGSIGLASAVVAGPTTTTTTTLPPTCADLNPVTTIFTNGKGQSAANNAKVVSAIMGNIVGAAGLGPTAHRIPVCTGTDVSTATTDATGTPTVTKSSAGVTCDASASCTIGSIGATEKYTVRSADGKDTDTLTFLPR